MSKSPKIAKGVKLKDVHELTTRWLKYTREDLARANSDIWETEYYQGMVDAYSDVLWALTTKPYKPKHHRKVFAIVPAALVIHAIIINNRKAEPEDA